MISGVLQNREINFVYTRVAVVKSVFRIAGYYRQSVQIETGIKKHRFRAGVQYLVIA
jgi:hypothetical protein